MGTDQHAADLHAELSAVRAELKTAEADLSRTALRMNDQERRAEAAEAALARVLALASEDHICRGVDSVRRCVVCRVREAAQINGSAE